MFIRTSKKIIAFSLLFFFAHTAFGQVLNVGKNTDFGNFTLYNVGALSVGSVSILPNGLVVGSGGIRFADGSLQKSAATSSPGTIAAGNVFSGSFGSNTGGGNYVFPQSLGIGITPLNGLDVFGGVAIGNYAGSSLVPGQTGLIVSGAVGIGTSTPRGVLNVVAQSVDQHSYFDSGGNYSDIRFSTQNNLYTATIGLQFPHDLAIANGNGQLILASGGGANILLTAGTGVVESDSAFRLNTTGSVPVCNAASRGTTWFAQGGAFGKDTYEICARNTSNVFAWQILY